MVSEMWVTSRLKRGVGRAVGTDWGLPGATEKIPFA